MKDLLKFLFFGISKGPGVEMKHPDHDDPLILRIGFNWQFLLLSGFFGLPLFFKGLWKWGLLMFAYSLISNYYFFINMSDAVNFRPLTYPQSERYSLIVTVLFSFFFGFKGNEMAAKKAFRDGWRLKDPESPMARRASKEWSFVANALPSARRKRVKRL